MFDGPSILHNRLERDHRTSLVALDELAQQTGKRPVFQKQGNIFFASEATKVSGGASRVGSCTRFSAHNYDLLCRAVVSVHVNTARFWHFAGFVQHQTTGEGLAST